jgi:hypothetical protein
MKWTRMKSRAYEVDGEEDRRNRPLSYTYLPASRWHLEDPDHSPAPNNYASVALSLPSSRFPFPVSHYSLSSSRIFRFISHPSIGSSQTYVDPIPSTSRILLPLHLLYIQYKQYPRKKNPRINFLFFFSFPVLISWYLHLLHTPPPQSESSYKNLYIYISLSIKTQ